MKKLKKDMGKLGEVSVGVGVGSAIAAKAGHGQEAFATMGGMMSPVTTGVMGMNTLRLVKKNLKKKR